MNIIAHLFLGSAVRNYTCRQIGVKLSWSGFLLGNILPDISGEYSRYPHFLKDSIEYIAESAKDLSYNAEEDVSMFEFSKQIGVINHYLSDYFCFAHCEEYKEDIYHHHFYEFMMLFALYRGLKSFKKNDPCRQTTPYELCSFIRARVAEYEREETCKLKDIDYALSVCSAATVGLLQTSFYVRDNVSAAYGLTQ